MKKLTTIIFLLIFSTSIIILLFIFFSNNITNKSSVEIFPKFKIAILLPNKINEDLYWSGAGYKALNAIKEKYHCQIEYAENTIADSAAIIEAFAAAEPNLIIALGAEFNDIMTKTALKYPLIKFALVSHHSGNNDNLGALAFKTEGISYILGAIAAKKTTSNKIAYIGGYRHAHFEIQFQVFEKAIKNINPDAEVECVWLYSFNDIQKSESAAINLIKNGTDIIFVNADKASIGAHKAAAENNIYSIGWLNDFSKIYPESVLASGIYNFEIMFNMAVELVLKGRWEGKKYKYGLTKNTTDVIYSEELLTKSEKLFISKLKKDITANRIFLY